MKPEPRAITLLRSMIAALETGDDETYWKLMELFGNLTQEMLDADMAEKLQRSISPAWSGVHQKDPGNPSQRDKTGLGKSEGNQMKKAKDLHAAWSKDPKYRAEYDALEEEFDLQSGMTHETFAFIRQCDTCRVTTAIDMDPTPEHWKELSLYGQTVRRVPVDEAMRLGKTSGSCKCKPL